MKLKDLLKKIGLDASHIYEVVPSGVFTIDKERKITSWNTRAAEITGYSSEEVLGKTCDSIFKSQSCRGSCGLFPCMVNKPIRDAECDITTKAGQMKIISKSSDLLRDKKGNIIGGIESFEDITERKKMEVILHKRAEILDFIDHPIYVVNENLEYLFGNSKLIARFGLSALDQIIGKTYGEFHTGDQTEDFACKIAEVYKTGETLRYEYTSRRGNKDKYLRTLSPNTDINGSVVSVTVSSDDISTIKTEKIEQFITICAYCKKIKDEKGFWIELEAYFGERIDSQFSHGMCPACSIEAYRELDLLR
ncbi:MAG: PAS domain S-box protein [Candidatus Aminicenantes bacterium]|nr:PAS domain S-box protein [Candidatus Aminicenantes bacterium]